MSPPTKKSASLQDRIRWHIRNITKGGAPADNNLAYPQIRLRYWTPENQAKVNFGDELSRTIVTLMLARRGATLQDYVPFDKNLLAIGSVLHLADDNSTVWGTGVHGAVPQTEHRYRSLDVRACRGPITQEFLKSKGIHAPSVFGDPGILIARLTSGRFDLAVTHKCGFVPNLHDMEYIRGHELESKYPDVKFIDPMRSWDQVVADVVQCEVVLASSLHGLVVADAYGRDAHYVRLTDHEPTLKYEDYYRGTGRSLNVFGSIEEARAERRSAPPSIDYEALEKSFPYDLWGIN